MAGRSPIYLAAARDRLLAFLRSNMRIEGACEQIGASLRTVERYMGANPAFAEKVRRAKLGENVEPECPEVAGDTDPPAESFEVVPEPCEPATVVDAEVVGDAPCDAVPVSPALLPLSRRPSPPPRPTKLGTLTRSEFDESVATVLRNPDHDHFAAMAKMVFPFFYGPELLAAKLQIERDAELQPGDKPERVLVIRVRESRGTSP